MGLAEVGRPERDKAAQGRTNGTIRQATAGRSDPAVSPDPPRSVASSNGAPIQASLPTPSLPPGAAPPSPHTALSALAAFYGTTSPSLSTLSSSSEDVTAEQSTRFFPRQFSSDGSLTTPSLSGEEGEATESKPFPPTLEQEKAAAPEYTQKLKALHDASEQTPAPSALPTASPEPTVAEQDGTTPTATPTLASFPFKAAPSSPAAADASPKRSERSSLFEPMGSRSAADRSASLDDMPKDLFKKPPGKNRDTTGPLSPSSLTSPDAVPISQLVVSRPPRRTSLLPSPVIPSTSAQQPTAHSRSSPSSPRTQVLYGSPFTPDSTPKRVVRSDADAIRFAALKAARQREEEEHTSAPEPSTEPDHDKPATDINGRCIQPRFEYAFATFAPAILKSLLGHIRYADLLSLRNVSKSLRRSIDVEGRELVLERFLGSQGYRSLASSPAAHKYRPHAAAGMINLDVRDLIAFRAGLQLGQDDYSRLARAYTVDPGRFSTASLRLARATTRAWNRVALRIRAQSLLPASSLNLPAYSPSTAGSPAYKPSRAALLRVWVPTRDGGSWMNDDELVECEREVYRSGVWTQLKKGDVVANVGVVLPFGNVSKLVYDGKFLRDLSFTYDAVGHLPNWLNMLSFSPAYFHNVIASSTPNPVIYLSLSAHTSAVRETMTLCKDKVSLSSPQGQYLVSRYVYRGTLRLVAGQIIGDAAGAGGLGPGGIEVVHEDWAGQVVVETEGTTEHATMLLARVASIEPTPWRVTRERSRPGRIWLRPVFENETA
ncbi:F-box domain contaning protein [Rhodotorula toruloides]|uniref:F-box domain contaning protein n=1 Tax=Rhodotorula toruloides TaxID=5286 RepID=A0A511KAD3_RHOTO|nr:F-box domain contaning protein [Rhodotorula toruloides]